MAAVAGPVPDGVRAATARVVARARSARIDPAGVEAAAARFAGAGEFAVPEWNTRYHWGDGTSRTANYVLLLDTLNFSFWGDPRWRIHYHGETLDGYWALAAALTRAVDDGVPILEAGYWESLDRESLGRILAGDGVIPLLDERVAAAREAGAWLEGTYQSAFVNAIEDAGRSAPGLANLLQRDLASFRDVATYDGEAVPLLKRAQICAADIRGAAGGRPWGALADMESLTAFADYKLPQILRSLRVLVYAPDLADRIDRGEELPPGGPEEVEIRAATVQAVDALAAAMGRLGRPVSPYQVDWYLWQAAQGGPHTAKPYHRTRTIYY